MDIKVDEKKILNTVNNCQFDKLAELEKKEGFSESVPSKNDDQKLKFFYLGKKNNWKKLLDTKIENRIRDEFLNEMNEIVKKIDGSESPS